MEEKKESTSDFVFALIAALVFGAIATLLLAAFIRYEAEKVVAGELAQYKLTTYERKNVCVGQYKMTRDERIAWVNEWSEDKTQNKLNGLENSLESQEQKTEALHQLVACLLDN